MKRWLAFGVIVLGVLSMAPTSGDIGGCGREASLLDVAAYAEARKDEDCERCQECGLSSARCLRSCDANAGPDTVIPPTCQPLRRDGEVCLRAIHAASCEKFATYVDDASPKAPSECEFCKIGPPTTSPLSEGGAP